MNKKEYLLSCLSEECGEVTQAVSKILRFGSDDHHPDAPVYETNKKRLSDECNDIYAVLIMLADKGIIDPINLDAIQAKKEKVQKYMDEYYDEGTLYIMCRTVSGKYAVRPSTWAGIWHDFKLDDSACRSLAYFDNSDSASKYIEFLEGIA